MGLVSGDLRLVTNQAARASEVIVRARDLHTQAGAVVLTAGDRVPVTEGRVSFTALPGPAVMVVVVDGRPTESVPLLVPDGDIGLADAVAAALALDDASFSELEALAVRVAAGVAGVETDLGSVRELKAAAEAAASSAGGSASAAIAAAQAAESARGAAAGSASTASQAASAAKGSQGAAAVSAQAAASSATAASASASAARNSQTAASSAQQAAVASQQAAAASASAAKDSQDAAAASAAQAADVVSSGVPDATADTKGKVRLAGDLGGTADAPTVPGLAGKANASHTHSQADITGLSTALAGKANTSHTHTLAEISDAPNSHTAAATASTLVSRDSSGRFQAATPTGAYHVANKGYVDTQLGVQNAVAAHAIPTAGSLSDAGVYLLRVGKVVQINVRGVASSASVTLPEGWRPVLDVDFMATNVADRSKMAWITVTKSGAVILSHTMTGSISLWGSTSYIVDSNVSNGIFGSPE